MAQQVINVGTVANDGTGDPLRTAFIKVNANFAEVYTLIPRDTGGNPVPVAPINDPHFTGDPQVPTAAPGDNDLSAANTAYVTAADNAVKAFVATTYAPINSPTFTGDPKAPTPADADNDTSIPTTAWVKRNFATISPVTPPPAGPDLSAYAPLASPVFTGNPQAPTPATNDNDTSIATTAFVMTALGAAGGGGGGGTVPASPLYQAIPQGRLTLQNVTPVMITNTTGVTSIFYTPYIGNRIPIWDGTTIQMTQFAELIGSTLDATKNPAPLGPNQMHDWFVWLDSTVPATPVVRLGHGPAWTDDTNRSAGTALSRVNGINVNNAAITNGPAAQRGTYVGTTRSDAASQLKWVQGGKGLGGVPAYLYVWNAYNRVDVWTQVSDTTTSWAPAASTGVVPRPLNSSVNNRVSFISGFAEDACQASVWVPQVSGTSLSIVIGMGYDVTNVNTGPSGWAGQSSFTTTLGAANVYPAQIGHHFIQATEWVAAAGGSIWGDGTVNGGALLGEGLQFTFRM